MFETEWFKTIILFSIYLNLLTYKRNCFVCVTVKFNAVDQDTTHNIYCLYMHILTMGYWYKTCFEINTCEGI